MSSVCFAGLRCPLYGFKQNNNRPTSLVCRQHHHIYSLFPPLNSLWDSKQSYTVSLSLNKQQHRLTKSNSIYGEIPSFQIYRKMFSSGDNSFPFYITYVYIYFYSFCYVCVDTLFLSALIWLLSTGVRFVSFLFTYLFDYMLLLLMRNFIPSGDFYFFSDHNSFSFVLIFCCLVNSPIVFNYFLGLL